MRTTLYTNTALATFFVICTITKAQPTLTVVRLTTRTGILPNDMSTLSTVSIFVTVDEQIFTSWPKDAGKLNFRLGQINRK